MFDEIAINHVCRIDLPAIFDNWGHIFQDFWPQTIWRTQWRAKMKCNQSRSELSDERVPNEEQGRACKNALEKGAAAAIKRAFPAWIQRSRIINGNESQDFYVAAKGGWTTSILYLRNMQAEPLDQWYHIPIFALDRHCQHRYLRSILETKLGTTHHCRIPL